MRQPAVENAELLPQEQDFEILIMVSLPAHSDQVQEDRADVCHKEKDHASRYCRAHAERRERQPKRLR